VEESDLPSATGTAAPQAAGSTASPPVVPATPAVDPQATAATPPASATEPPAQQPAILLVDPTAQALYDRGYTLYHQGRYLDAEASFQRFLQAYPRTDLSDNAQFWIGESRFARDDLTGALAAFRETLQRYPEGNKVPDALIKEGDCLAGLGDKDGARGRYEEVSRRFPGSAAAVMAEERIRDLN
jgi:tol-pal system protein YbgF